MSKLALQLIEKAKREKAKTLDLGRCGLRELPEELFELGCLEELYLCNRYFDYEQRQWIDSQNKGLPNHFSQLEGIQHLVNLKTLYAGGEYKYGNWSISDISILQNLTQLQTLDLRSNNISDISILQNLTQLQTLDLSDNNISDISILQNLTQLQKLYLRANNISDISTLQNLTQLQTLDLISNNISDISILQNLTQLQTLDLRVNNISDISPIRHLIELSISVSLEEFSTINKINLHNNPLTTPPPEVVKQGNRAILNYFEELDKQGLDYLYEAKLLIIGEGGAGKTTLARKLINATAAMPEEEETTKGIDIHTMPFTTPTGNDFTINLWDFGGQEIYHATHQFFLTKRSLYVLVDDTRKDDKTLNDATFNYWLQTVELFGGESPLLIVQNEKGDRSKDIDLIGMQKRFSFIKQKHAINLLNNRGLEAVKETIEKHIQTLPHIGQAIPKQWLAVRTELAKKSETHPFITQEDFFTICSMYKLPERERALNLSSHLHHLGFFLHFQEDPVLKNIVILQNAWATEAVYQILDSELIKSQNGLFAKTDVSAVWTEERYCDKHDELLALMKKFELCYELKEAVEERYLIPQLLPVSKPETYQWKSDEDLQLRYKYGFMPKGLLSRFIVRMHIYIHDLDKIWRKGVVMERNGAYAEIMELYGENEIAIRVKGNNRKEFITVIDEEFDRIHRPLEGNLKLTKLIPCNCSNCSVLEQPHFFKYNKLKERLEIGKRTIECETPNYEDVDISRLLFDVFVGQKGNFKERVMEAFEDIKKGLGRVENTVKETHQLLAFSLTDSSKIQYPYLFTLAPPSYELLGSQSLKYTKYHLQFYCMHSENIHVVGKPYDIQVPKEWLSQIAPYYNQMLGILKSGSHLLLPSIFNTAGAEIYKDIKPNLEGIRDSIKVLQPIDVGTPLRQYEAQEATEACMEMLKQVLSKCDPKNTWNNHLQKKTEDGKVIWVCGEHV